MVSCVGLQPVKPRCSSVVKWWRLQVVKVRPKNAIFVNIVSVHAPSDTLEVLKLRVFNPVSIIITLPWIVDRTVNCIPANSREQCVFTHYSYEWMKLTTEFGCIKKGQLTTVYRWFLLLLKHINKIHWVCYHKQRTCMKRMNSLRHWNIGLSPSHFTIFSFLLA